MLQYTSEEKQDINYNFTKLILEKKASAFIPNFMSIFVDKCIAELKKT